MGINDRLAAHQTFPLGGRWQPEGLTDEGTSHQFAVKCNKMRQMLRPSSASHSLGTFPLGGRFFLR